MTAANLLLGLTIGLPMMIAVGPISVLLLDQGLERGIRVAAPAALGVATADLSFSVVASVAGGTVTDVLAPIERWLTLSAVGVLVWLAVDLGRSAAAELRAARPSAARPAPDLVAAGHLGRAAGTGADAELGESVTEPAADTDGVGSAGSPFSHLAGWRLAGAFYGLTLVNPLTIVLFASVVIAGGSGVGTAGWALGMALASLIAHGSFVVLGGMLGTTLGPVATARLRIGAALFMGALALHFALGA
jgi:threonine/homoserine/homoserine lactone efflux protein